MNESSGLQISIIIPAFNEERHIASQLSSLRELTTHLPVEIIVVDNLSTDRTSDLARQHGADLVMTLPGSVAAIRNSGARRAKGNVLIFMDADVFPTRQWADHVSGVAHRVLNTPQLLTGSWVAISTEPSWIESNWFAPLQVGSSTHINSGHLIVSRRLFDELNGFKEEMETGEDFDFSLRARAAGATIVDDPTLLVVHKGYPKTLREFFRREMWHGGGDFQSLDIMLHSRVALLGLLVLHLSVVGLLGVILMPSGIWPWLVLVTPVAISVAVAMVRYRKAPLRTRCVNSLLYLAYFLARGSALYFRKSQQLRTESGERH
jgi:glycosyltransferase involved in cell wall biosynthesis